MTDKIQKVGLPMPKGVILDSVSLVISDSLLFDQWQEIGDSLRKVEGGVMWWLGDWLNHGEREYGEKYSQALDATDYAYQTLNGARWVADRIEPMRRRKSLTFGHHREVAALEVDRQEELLKKAEKENWTVKQLREAVQGPKEPAEPKDEDLKTFTCEKFNAVVLAKDAEAAAKRLMASKDPGDKRKIGSKDVEEWPREGETVRFMGAL